MIILGGSLSRSFAANPQWPTNAEPPRAKQVEYSETRHGETISDSYHWLKDQSYPTIDDEEVLSYLRSENEYFEAMMRPLEPLVEQLFGELKGRVVEDDASVPAKDGAYTYWWKFGAGDQYRKWFRRPIASEDSVANEQLVLDEPRLASSVEYFRLGSLSVSPNAKLAAYSSDTSGAERFTIQVKDIAQDEILPDRIEMGSGEVVWSNDSKGFFYTLVNENWRPYVVKYHALGTDIESDRVIYTESDEGFFVGIDRTKSRKYLLIGTADHVTSEVHFISLDDPYAKPTLISERKVGRQYDVDEREGDFYIRTNDTHVNFRLVKASVSQPNSWVEIVAGSDDEYLTGHASFQNQLVVATRVQGLDQIRLYAYDDFLHFKQLEMPEPSYAVGLGENEEYLLGKLRLRYQSMVTPATVMDYDLQSGKFEIKKVQQIPSGYDKDQYETRRLMAKSRDGKLIPVSIVYKKGFQPGSGAPLHLYGYGAYGMGMPPSFSANRLSLLDRGFVYAIAHIRGGDDMGYGWYLDGKLDKRANTFNDFVDVANFLIAQGYAKRGEISASGGSAGGWLMGAVVEQDPGLWKAIAAHVPFVDVLNTMLDESLPLTPMEWPEWGNPIEDAEAFQRIRTLSPYDLVSAKDYPALLITGGLNDPRVTYWEPAKWTAKLRSLKTDNNPLLLKINMGAGHGGKSGRFDSLRETAEEYAFILNVFGLGNARAK